MPALGCGANGSETKKNPPLTKKVTGVLSADFALSDGDTP